MATRYKINLHPQIFSDDLPSLPDELKSDLDEIFKPTLSLDPYGCAGLPNHPLKGQLKGWRAIEIEWEGDPNAYRLVYRILEKPAPKRVEIISFGLHDPAYDNAQSRSNKRRNKK